MNLKDFAKKNGFEYEFVSQEEREDGVGVCVGDNYIKNGIWYTKQQMVSEVGLELKRRTVRSSEKAIIEEMEQVGVIAYQIEKFAKGFRGQPDTYNVYYVK